MLTGKEKDWEIGGESGHIQNPQSIINQNGSKKIQNTRRSEETHKEL